jgi:hypothetical protein
MLSCEIKLGSLAEDIHNDFILGLLVHCRSIGRPQGMMVGAIRQGCRNRVLGRVS